MRFNWLQCRDAQACWLSPEDYEEDESWIEQQLLAFKASTDPDTMYYHQAMKEPDKEQFLTAIDKECEAHFKGNMGHDATSDDGGGDAHDDISSCFTTTVDLQ